MPTSNFNKRFISVVLLLGSVLLVFIIYTDSNLMSGMTETQETLVQNYAFMYLGISLVFCFWNLIRPWPNKFWFGVLIVLLLAIVNYPARITGKFISDTTLGCSLLRETYTCTSVAIKTLDPKYCAIMNDDYKSERCYADLAKVSKNYEYCFKIPAFSGSLEARDSCLFEVQDIVKNKDICGLINDPRSKSVCVNRN